MPAATAIDWEPEVTDQHIVFRYPDEEHALTAVRLYQEVQRPRNGPEFEYDDGIGGWILYFPRPQADRLEYMVELEHPDGNYEMLADPNNPQRVGGPFGDKSEVRMPGYQDPWWLEESAPEGRLDHLSVRCRPLRTHLPVSIWGPAGSDPDEPLPLLFVHDGPEYGEHSALTHYFEVMTGDGQLPPFRAALIGPADRNNSYSASAAYARSFSHEIVPAIVKHAPTPHGRSMRAGMGASLGALAMLHIHRRNPATFGGLFLQSGSYFRQRFDPQESGFPRFRRISRFVGEVLTAENWAHPIRAVLTCGSIEENLANNRAVLDALRRQDYEADLHINPDGHNWTGWRDTFDPHLSDLIGAMWG